MPRTTLVGSLIVILFILAGCVTPGKSEPKKPGNTGAAKVGSKTDPGATPPGSTKVEPVAIVGTPPLADQLAFVQRHTSPHPSFDDKDQQLLAALPGKPDAGSVTEAALAVGIVKAINNPADSSRPSFDEQDIGGNGAGKGSPLSLESRCQERGVRLAEALAQNPLLASPAFAKQVIDALERHRVSEGFKSEVQGSLRRSAELWASVAAGLGGAQDPTAPPQAEPVATVSDDTPLNPADLKGVDSALAEAEALADRGEFKAAIKKAQALPPASPMRQAALAKVKEFSNRGVQDLRRKAADAFQNARPVSDPKARAAYLQQAKGYLEEAIKDYPEATLLPTVRDNLRMISRDLEQIQGEKR